MAAHGLVDAENLIIWLGEVVRTLGSGAGLGGEMRFCDRTATATHTLVTSF